MNYCKILNDALKNTNLNGLINLYESTEYICDGICEKTFKYLADNNVKIYNFNQYMMCKDCKNNDEFRNKFNFIDRVNYTVEEKPLSWTCLYCNLKMGGGFTWYNSLYFKTDICVECYKKDFKEDFKKIKDIKKYFICNRFENHVLLNFNQLDKIVVPKELQCHISEKTIRDWIECFDI